MKHNDILKNEQNKGSIYHHKNQLHAYTLTPKNNKNLYTSVIKKIYNTFIKMGIYIKSYFCFANFFL